MQDLRCTKCGRIVGRVAGAAEIVCKRCGTMVVSEPVADVQARSMLDVIYAAVTREAPAVPANNVNVHPTQVRFEEGAISVAAPDMAPLTGLADSIAKMAARPVPVNEVTVHPTEVHIDEGAIRVDVPPSNVEVHPASVTVESPNVTVNVPEPRRTKTIGRDKAGNLATIDRGACLMAANPKFSNTCVNAEADAVGDALNTGYIRIYDGSQPANADAGTGGATLLAELRFGADAFGAAVAGVITANAIAADASGGATGTATWARILASDRRRRPTSTARWTRHPQTSCLNTVSIVSGALVSCSACTFAVSKGWTWPITPAAEVPSPSDPLIATDEVQYYRRSTTERPAAHSRRPRLGLRRVRVVEDRRQVTAAIERDDGPVPHRMRVVTARPSSHVGA